MTRDEAKILVITMKTVYPNYHPADETFTVNTWASMLEEYDFSQVQMAFKKFVLSDTSGFAPSIGQLVAEMQEINENDNVGELEAWGMVSKAIRNSGYHAVEEFNRLPPLVQRAVYSPGNLEEWAKMDTDTVNSVIQSHVIRNYRAAAKAARDEAKLPPKFLELMKTKQKIPDRLIAKEPVRIEERKPDPEEGSDHNLDLDKLLDDLRRRLDG